MSDLAIIPLTPADLAERAAHLADESAREPKSHPEPPTIARLRDYHHAVARMLAGGMSANHCAALLGTDPRRIKLLLQSPTFQELLAFYRERADEVVSNLDARLRLFKLDVLALIHERLLDPDQAAKISESSLMKMLTDVMDRTGQGTATSVAVQHSVLTDGELARIKTISGSAETVQVVTDVRSAAKPLEEETP
jgi:hypothetical protein